MKALVIGYSGTIGNAVTQLLQEKGYEVIPASRSADPGINMDDPSSIDNFFAGIDEVDAIVAVAGYTAGGPIDKLTDEQVDQSLKSKLAGQINIVRKGLTKLRPNGVFVITGGMLAFMSVARNFIIRYDQCRLRCICQSRCTRSYRRPQNCYCSSSLCC
ncbi:MAG: NAD-dependent epimerase/dehydratase family protein [Segetibacter sp.]